MIRFIQHDALFIRHFTAKTWPFELHNHNHFELVFIHSGKGYHFLNDEKYDYAGPCVYMLTPADHHIFDIIEETQFSVLKFTNVYLSGGHPSSFEPDWDSILNNLRNACRDHDGLSKYAGDLGNVSQLIYLIVKEWEARPFPNNEVILHLMRGVVSILRQAMEDKLQDQFNSITGDSTRLLHYIHQHIHDPAKLQTDAIAANLNFTKGRLQLLFRQQMGTSVKDYINDYKCRLIENRLLFSSLTIKEISNEFGFTDLSHLNKFFRKLKGVSPRNYRNNHMSAREQKQKPKKPADI
ncbi:MAG TPA: AraC family transcriptional regulator [Puia sp.]